MTNATVDAAGSRIILQFDCLDDALRLLTPWKGSVPRAQAARQIHGALHAVGLGMEVKVKGRTVVELGQDEMRGPLLALLDPAL